MFPPRVRIAPSPTGNLHIGTARTALFNYLFAKKHGGSFVLRIEDTDVERSDPKFEKDIFEGLKWLGIEWDEGPAYAIPNSQFPIPNYIGNYGPYRQSERTEIYRTYLQRLLDEDKAFYCFHSERELEEEKEQLMAAKKPVLHLCEYRTLGKEEGEILKETKDSFLIRFKTPPGRTVTFRDAIRGLITFETNLLGDFSLAKRADIPLYNFAVVADDATMEITHVIRGEDHIANTPKQILIMEALGFLTPTYAHLPLILGPDRSKLSKRHGATSVTEYRNQGYLPEALINFMALLGWNSGGDQELFTKEELIKEFSLEKVQKSGAVFDMAKLEWMNGEYIRRKSPAELAELCKPFLGGLLQSQNAKRKTQNDTLKFKSNHLEKIIVLEQPRLKKLSDITEQANYFFRQPEYDKELLRWKDMNHEDITASLEQAEKILQDMKEPITKESLQEDFFRAIGDGDKGRLLWSLRVALTGKKASPGPFEVIEILGIEETMKRIEVAKRLVGAKR